MSQTRASNVNDQAFRRLRATLDAQYPAGQYIALEDGQVIADAGTVQNLQAKLLASGKNPREVFVVQSGVDYPEFATILFSPPLFTPG